MQIRKYINILNNISLFEGFSPLRLTTVLENSPCRIDGYQKDSVIYLQNQKCTTLDIILRGEILIQKIDAEGGVLTVSSFGFGEHLGANLLFADNNTYPMTAVSKTHSTLLHIPGELVLDLCAKDRTFLEKFLRCLSNRTLVLTNKLHTLSMKTLRHRIFEFLAYEYYRQKSLTIELPMTKKELSEKLGVQRPSLSRELSKMRDDGILEFDLKYITIKELDSILKDL